MAARPDRRAGRRGVAASVGSRVRAARGLQPRRGGHHVARARVRDRRSQPAQLPLPDVLLLRPLRVGWRIVRRELARRRLSVARGVPDTVLRRSDRGPPCGSRARGRVRGRHRGAGFHAGTTALRTSRAGLAAALFLSVAPTHVRDSHYVKHDVPVTLAIVAAYLAIVALGRRHERRRRLPATGGVFTRRRAAPILSRALCVVSPARRTTTRSSSRCLWPSPPGSGRGRAAGSPLCEPRRWPVPRRR